MKRLVVLVALVVLLAGFLLSGIGDISTPSNEVTNTVSETDDSNSSASATITITIYPV